MLAPPPGQAIYVSKGDQDLGPFTFDELVEQMSKKQFEPTDLAWHQGVSNWMALEQLPEWPTIQEKLKPANKPGADPPPLEIKKAPPMATGWTCMRFGWTAYVVPFLFVFSPSLLLQGSVEDLIIDVSSAIAGVWLISAGMIGYFARNLDIVGRAAFLLAGILLLIPSELGIWAIWTDWVGWSMGIAVVFWDIRMARKLRIAV